MARRASSAASRSSSRGASSRSTARTSSDGKVDIYCPQCGAHFRLAETSLDSKVQCTECSRAFIAKATAGKRARKPDNTKVYAGFGVGVVLIVGTLVMMSRGGGEPVARPVIAAAPEEAQLDIDRAARRDQIMRWARAVAGGDMITVRNYSDFRAICGLLGVDAGLGGDAADAAFLAAAKTNDAMRLFHEMECASVDVPRDATKAGGGPATLYFNTRPEFAFYDPKAGAQITVQWRLDGSQLKVTDFKLTGRPIQRGQRPGDENKVFKPSAEIAQPKRVEIDLNGRKKSVNEAQPVPIAHLADTPVDQQQVIDRLVGDLLRSADENADAKLFGRTVRALENIGKPAMPRLINALNDLYPDVMGNNVKISQVTRALLQMTGMALAYDVAGTGDAAKDKTARESVIRQWFAWWWRYANDDFTENIDKEESLEPKGTTKK